MRLRVTDHKSQATKPEELRSLRMQFNIPWNHWAPQKWKPGYFLLYSFEKFRVLKLNNRIWGNCEVACSCKKKHRMIPSTLYPAPFKDSLQTYRTIAQPDTETDTVKIQGISMITGILHLSLSQLSLHPQPQLSLGDHRSALHLHNAFISCMFCKWNHVVFNLLGLACFTQQIYLQIHPSLCVWKQFVPDTVFWTIHLAERPDQKLFLHTSSHVTAPKETHFKKTYSTLWSELYFKKVQLQNLS